MPSDIRSFLGPKTGSASSRQAVAKKPAADATKSRRAARRVVESDDEDDEPTNVKAPAKTTAKKPTNEVKGIEMTASQYFSSDSPTKSEPTKTITTPKADRTSKIKIETPLRISPRLSRTTAPQVSPSPKPATTSTGRSTRRTTTAFKETQRDIDGDAYKDDADEDADDIFAAAVKSGGKNCDDYEEDDESDDDPVVTKRLPILKSPKSVPAKKRKSSEKESEDEEEEEAPRKKAAPAKPRAPRTVKKAAEPEDSSIQNILDNVPLVRAPTPPPKDTTGKYDWRKAAAGGGGNSTAPPLNPGASDLTEGEEECLSGLNFVFTGVLQTVGREEAQALVKKYGGKVTGQPSSKTSFVVLGDDAGPSKLAKIKQMGVKSINEEGLFDLIRKLPAFGGSGKGAVKAQEKKKADELKVQQQAEEMEKEDKARRLADERAAKKAAEARGLVHDSTQPAAAAAPTAAQLLTTKYAPTSLSHICGNKANVEKLQLWLRNWPKHKKYNFSKRGADGMGGARAVIMSGPPGIGKTTAAHLAARLEGYDVLESNASDVRSKKLVENGVAEVMNNTSLHGFFAGDGKKVDVTKKKIVLVMDEVDGMSAGDRGGVGALAKFCKKTEVPIVLICNERRLPKMRPFDQPYIYDIRFQRPTVDQVRSRIMTICHREGVKMPPPVVDALIEGSNKDIRQIINMISTAKLDQSSMNHDEGKAMAKAWEKHVILKPWDICSKMLSGGMFAPASKATLNDKIELYFNDHEMSYLMIQENYLRTRPLALGNAQRGLKPAQARLRELELFDAAAGSISDGDLVDRMIHGPQQHWSLMPTHAVFSSVRPASFVAGQLMGTEFTSWLGQNSKQGKLYRFVREIHSHMRLRTSGDANEVRQQYLPVLWDRIVRPLSTDGTGKDAVDDVIELMDSYYLTRDDFDAVMELGLGPQRDDTVTIETQTKSTFTRRYNSVPHPVPFMKASTVTEPLKKGVNRDVPDLEEAIEEEDEGDVVEAEPAKDDELDIKDDKYIKKPKAKPTKKTAAAAAAAKGGDGEDGEAGSSSGANVKAGRARGGAAVRGKGRGK